VAVWQDARRGEVFTAIYRVEGSVLEPVESPRCQDAPSWLTHLEALEREAPLHRVGPDSRLQADSVARLGALRLAAGLQDDPVSARPSYLREASATPNWRPLATPLEGHA
jgi:tRNA A37 threonylcarbamoyladenosine modification protein TsaB